MIGKGGERWPGLSYPLGETKYSLDWLQRRGLGMKKVQTSQVQLGSLCQCSIVSRIVHWTIPDVMYMHTALLSLSASSIDGRFSGPMELVVTLLERISVMHCCCNF